MSADLPPPSDPAVPSAPRRWLRIGHLELSDLLVETFSVLLGVLLALAINGWVQQRQERQKLDAAQASIRGELQSDRRRLAEMAAYYHLIGQQLEAAAGGPHPPAHCDELPQWNGLMTPLLLHAAYDTASSSGVFANMPFEDSSRVAALYAELAGYETFAYKVEDWMVQRSLSARSPGFDTPVCGGFVRDLERSAVRVQNDLNAYLGPAPVDNGAGLR